MDDFGAPVWICAVLSAIGAYTGVRKLSADTIERYQSAARLRMPFAGSSAWGHVERRITAYKRLMNVVQVVATLVGCLIGVGLGMLLQYVDRLVSSHG